MSEIEQRQGGAGTPLVLHWYDFICPFCYVGQHRSAILLRHGLRVVELPFQIHPEIPQQGVAVGPRQGPMYAMLEREAKAAGLQLRWPSRLPNTRLALALAEWTRQNDANAFAQLHRRIFDAHFVLGQDLGDPDLLDEHAKASGVDLAALHGAVTSGSAEAAVAEAEALGRGRGVEATPAWLLPQGLISGLRPAAEFERMAEHLNAKS